MKEVEQDEELNEIVLTSYLQLFLAKSSKIKRAVLTEDLAPSIMVDEIMERFKILLEQHFLALHKPSDYANLLHITPNVLSKRCKLYFRKTPTQLIQERIIIEAKKKIHLTRLSIKEIAFELQFQDEHYFSRFFKKITGISPQKFRNSAGISIVADLSMQ
ncbi:helix-turn-helix domain-containing protein [Flavobacterium sp. '19STA2R22 D10 B1']|uniref:helix-turn-helix domain-containing protein n=1 Tax=Flavobacterium aerium TaxID=3037261 RepID=UPI00278C3E06|nr:helix-turn-helix domain-containing protein [Flavobacterium sp. '19STA2R22 D10 B1']